MTTPTVQIYWKLSLVMSLVLLAPGVSLAAEGEAPLPAAATPTPPSLHDATEKAEPKRKIHPALRVAAEVGAMSVTSVAAGAGGIALTLETCDTWGTGLSCLDRIAVGMIGGATLGAPLGTWLGGELTGGQGTFLGALLGSGAGLAVGAGASLLVYNDNIKPYCLPVGAMIGSVIGYEVSHSLASAPQSPRASTNVQPVLAFSSQGAVLGLNGRF